MRPARPSSATSWMPGATRWRLLVLQSTTRAVIVGGAAAGGLVVALFGARPALAADGFTFIASALLILVGTRARPAAASASASAGDSGGENALAQIVAGARLVFGDPTPHLMGLGWLSAFSEIPEGLAAYVGKLGGGAVAAAADRLLATRGGGGDAGLHQEDRPAHALDVDGPDGGVSCVSL